MKLTSIKQFQELAQALYPNGEKITGELGIEMNEKYFFMFKKYRGFISNPQFDGYTAIMGVIINIRYYPSGAYDFFKKIKSIKIKNKQGTVELKFKDIVSAYLIHE